MLALALSLGLTLGLAKLPQVEAQPSSTMAGLAETRLLELEQQLHSFGSLSSGLDLKTTSSPVSVYVQLHERQTKSGLTPNRDLHLQDQAGMDSQIAYAQALHQEFLADLSSVLGHKVLADQEVFLVDNALTLQVTGPELQQLVAHPDVRNIQLDLPVIPKPQLPSPEQTPKRRARRDLSEAYDPSSLKGAGTVIAILDSGFQVDHEGMAAPTDKTAMRYNATSIQAKIASGSLKGQYVNEKFPYGYNYADQDQDLAESGESHGTHVSGIAAGTGDKEGRFVGQAPQAQVLAMRVFSKGASKGTRPAIYNAALDDAIYLQADVINMSLGSDFGTLHGLEEATLAAIEKAKQIGALFSISAGNSSYANEDLPVSATNPWISTLGSPAIAPSALAVASVNGMESVNPILKVGDQTNVPYQPGKVVPVDTLYDQPLVVADAGRGDPKQASPAWASLDLQGKAALIERGDITFVEKVNNAAEKGAKLAIIYQHEEGGDNFVGMVLDGTKIPAISVKRSDGLKILELLKTQPDLAVTVTKAVGGFPYDDGGKMSDFSSWGPSPEFDLKPEITAVGGNVYAPQPGNTYGNMSGTSMSAPQISGMIALLHERYTKDDRISIPAASEAEARFYLTRNLLMSTAVPHQLTEQPVSYDSPRKQGAGIATNANFLSSQAYATAVPEQDGGFADAKLNLGAMNELEFDLKFVVHNISKTETLTFAPSATVQTDKLKENPAFIDVGGVQDVIPAVSGTPVTVQPSSSETVTLHVQVPAERHQELLSHFINGYYLEGFVRLKSQTAGQCDIGLPWISFRSNASGKGQSGIPALEPPIYDAQWNLQDAPKPKFYDTQTTAENEAGSGPNPFTALVSTVDGKTVVAGETTQPGSAVRTFDGNKIYLTPNGDGKNDFVGMSGIFQFSLFEAYARVVDSQGTEVFKSRSEGTLEDPIGQSNYDKTNTDRPFFNVPGHASTWDWDGKKAGTPVPDGIYTYEFHVKSTSDAKPGLKSEDIPEQVTKLQVIVDSKAPELKDAKFENGQYEGDLVEEGSGMKSATLVLKGSNGAPDQPVAVEVQGNHLRAQIPEDADLFQYELTLVDQAGNEKKINLGLSLLTEFGSIQVTYKDQTGKPVTVKEGELKLQFTDEKGHVFTDPQKLPYGKYKVTAESQVPRLVVQNSPQEAELTAENKEQTVTFTLEVLTVRKVRIDVSMEPAQEASSFPGKPVLTATNKKTGQVVQFEYTSFFGILNFFNAELTDGQWILKLGTLPDGWWSPFKDTEVEISEDSLQLKVRIIKGERCAIEPQTTVRSGDLDPASVEYMAYNGEYYEDLSQLASGVYLVFPVLTEEQAKEYYVEPDNTIVQLQPGQVQKPEFVFTKLTEETYGKIIVETKMEDGSEPIEVTYIAESLLGHRAKELGHIPYGNWYVEPDVYDPNYVLVSESTQKVQINEKTPEVHVSFTFARASSVDKKGAISILPSWSSYGDQEMYEEMNQYTFTLKNLTTGTEDTVTLAPSFLTLSMTDVPFGYYELKPVLQEPYYTDPESLFVKVDSDKQPAEAVFQYRVLKQGETKPQPESWKQTVQTDLGPVTLEIPAQFVPKMKPGMSMELRATALSEEELQELKAHEPEFATFTEEQKALSLFDVNLVLKVGDEERLIKNRELPTGFTAKLTLPAQDEAFSKLEVQSFFLNSEGQVFEKKAVQVQNQTAELMITHLSHYGLLATGEEPVPPTPSPDPNPGSQTREPGAGGYFKPLIPGKQPSDSAPALSPAQSVAKQETGKLETTNKDRSERKDSVPATGEKANERIASIVLVFAAFAALGMLVIRRRNKSSDI